MVKFITLMVTESTALFENKAITPALIKKTAQQKIDNKGSDAHISKHDRSHDYIF